MRPGGGKGWGRPKGAVPLCRMGLTVGDIDLKFEIDGDIDWV
jgi:hypothetical protein